VAESSPPAKFQKFNGPLKRSDSLPNGRRMPVIEVTVRCSR